MAMISLMLCVVVVSVGVGAFAVLAIWLKLIFSLLDALVQQVPRGLHLFFRLTYGFVVRSVRVALVLRRLAKRGGLRAAQHAYVWLFVWSYRLRCAYVTSELKKRRIFDSR